MLSDYDILKAIEDGKITIEPFNIDFMNPNSYDVTLGREFYYLSHTNDNQPIFYGPITLGLDEFVFVPPGGTLLGRTIETIGARVDLFSQIRAKSTTRRLGISVCDDAGYADVGYCQPYTVELTSNTRGGSSPLVVGGRFAQVVFDRTETKPLHPYNGQYATEIWPQCMIPKKYRNKQHILAAPDYIERQVRTGWEYSDE